MICVLAWQQSCQHVGIIIFHAAHCTIAVIIAQCTQLCSALHWQLGYDFCWQPLADCAYYIPYGVQCLLLLMGGFKCIVRLL